MSLLGNGLTGVLPPPPPPDFLPGWLNVLGLTFGFAVAFLMCFKFAREKSGAKWGRRNTNLYFDEEILSLHTSPDVTLQGGEAALPLQTLVVHAELLDEVNLAFSSEPLVYGALFPALYSLTHPEIVPPPPSSVVGAEADAGQAFVDFFRDLLIYPYLNILRRPFAPIVQKYLTTKLLQILSVAATGLPPKEFSEARIIPGNRLNLRAFFEEWSWDVGKLILHEEPTDRDVSMLSRLKRYAFLWDDKVLQGQKEGGSGSRCSQG